MDERALSLIFLLLAGVLPLRSLGATWADRPDRRRLFAALVVLYLAAGVIALGALMTTGRRERAPDPSISGPEQLARAASACAPARARA